jgi:hypothetical protein
MRELCITGEKWFASGELKIADFNRNILTKKCKKCLILKKMDDTGLPSGRSMYF